jgi:hypothetical protein
MNAQLQLHYHATHFKFALVKEGEDLRQKFDAMEDALKCAARMGGKSIPLIVVNDFGMVTAECIITTEPRAGHSAGLFIRDSQALDSFIEQALKARSPCRVFQDVLQNCFFKGERAAEEEILPAPTVGGSRFTDRELMGS